MTFHCYLQWIWGPINLTVSVFSWSTWVRVATKAFWKHLWETPSQTCISFCGTAVLAWCVAPTMCASARNMMLRTTDHVCKCKKHETWCCVQPTMCASARDMMLHVVYNRPCVQVQETWCCVQPTMCASARNMMLRSTNHVCKCKKHDVAYNRPCVQVRETWCCVAPTMCASARKMMLRSTDHVCKCKERYHPHPTPPHPQLHA